MPWKRSLMGYWRVWLPSWWLPPRYIRSRNWKEVLAPVRWCLTT